MKSPKILWIALPALSIVVSAFAWKTGTMKLPKSLRENYVWLDAGITVLDAELHPVDGFIISKTEVSNREYGEFLNDLKTQGRMDEYAAAYPDTTQWSSDVFYKQPYVTYYFSHYAYADYPVVNISYQGAWAYCKWLQEKVNAEGDLQVEVRLPSRNEWIHAARGDNFTSLYAWEGIYVRDAKGNILCNFNRGITTDNFRAADSTQSDGGDVTAPVISYYPNETGLYNMNGNVAEMINEEGIAVGGSWHHSSKEVLCESTLTYTGPSPFVGFRPVMILK